MVLFCIYVIALLLRLLNLGDIPSGFHQDEVVNAYVGRFILENGIDPYGNKWPLLFFDKRGDFPPVLPMYISALGTYLFGFTQFAGRFPIAIIGSLIVFPVFFITKLIFNKNLYAYVAALTIATLPWHTSFSRIGAEGAIAVTVFMYAVWLLLISINRKNVAYLILSFSLFILTYFLYPSFRIIVPLTFLVASVVYFHSKKLKAFLIGATVLSVFFTLYISTTDWGQGRYAQTSLHAKYSSENNPASKYIFNENNVFLARVFNNKVVYIGRDFTNEYMSYFSPQFLFGQAGQPVWFDVPNTGLFYFAHALLLLMLFFPFLYKKNSIDNKKGFIFMIVLVFISPVASALTSEFTPNTHRSLLLSVTLIIPIVYGFILMQNFKLRSVLNIFIVLLWVAEFTFFFHNYFQHVSMASSVLRGDGNRQVVEYIDRERHKYEKVNMLASGWFPIYYLYFTGNFDRNLAGKIKINLRTEKVGNVTFVEEDCPSPGTLKSIQNEKQNTLLVLNSSCSMRNLQSYKKIGEIAGADRVPVYGIYTN